MVKITSDGDDRNKKKEKEENLRNLPEGVTEMIIARIPRDGYPNLSLAFKAFRDMITSAKLFETRSSLGRTESVLYAFIGFPPSASCANWHILHRRNNSLRLGMIKSLPTMSLGSAVVTIGHEIYIIGGNLHSSKPVSSVFAIDSRFHTWRPLPDMRRARNYASAGVIDGKIYVIGGCTKQGGDWIEVFDVKNQIWETMPSPNVVMEEKIHILGGFFGPHVNVVMEDKIYIWLGLGCFSYEPRLGRWESWGLETPLRIIWPVSCCVVDDMLYSLNPICSLGYPIVVYDPRNVGWRPVKGVSKEDLLNLLHYESKIANFGGKLVILGRGQWLNSCDSYKERDIGCIVIALERRDHGEIYGHVVQSNSCVLTCSKSPFIEHSRTVTV